MNLNETDQLLISFGMHFSVAEYIEAAGATLDINNLPSFFCGIPLHNIPILHHT
jgi:hypothetical protein